MTFDLENPDPGPGDALRDEAANLLSTKFGRPIREQRVIGKKVDLSFVRRSFGKEDRFFVEAKDYAENLSRSEVVHIWADYEGLVRKHAPATLLLITRNGLSSDAQAYVQDEQPSMRHQTIWELENEMMGLLPYTRSLAEIFGKDGLDTYYIAGRSRAASYEADGETRVLDPVDADLFETVQAWLASDDHHPMAILGGYGAGKTSFAKRLTSWQAARALEDPLARRPILIGLGAVARYSSIEGLLGGMFTHDFPVEGFNVHHFLEMSDKGRMLVILDGFDEMKHAMTWSDFRNQIMSLNRLTKGRSKVLLLGRPSAFTSAEEHVHVLRGMKRHGEGWRRLPDWPEFREHELQEFSPESRAEFVKAYLRFRMSRLAPDARKNEAWIAARAAEVNRLADHDPEIFGKPVHAKILTDLAADPQVDLSRFADGVSRWQLYETFFHSLVERETEKEARRPVSERDRLDFVRAIAFWLWAQKGGSTDFHAADLPDTLLTQFPADEAADLDALKREYLTGSFLEKKSGDIFYFGHRSFAEYLVAERMVLHPPSAVLQSVYSSLTRDGVAVFLREAPDRRAVQSWAGSLSQAQGTIHFEYLEFIAEAFGGPEALAQALPERSIWLPVLAAFGPDMKFSVEMRPRLLAEMERADELPFFLLVCLLTFYAGSPAFATDPRGWNTAVAAILLTRVFRTASFDENSGKARIEEADEGWRVIALRVLPEMTDAFGERDLVFRGPQLIQLMVEHLRAAGVDLAFQSITTRLSFANEEHLTWSEVLAQMPLEQAEIATGYFRRNATLRSVFSVATRSVRGHTDPRGRNRQA